MVRLPVSRPFSEPPGGSRVPPGSKAGREEFQRRYAVRDVLAEKESDGKARVGEQRPAQETPAHSVSKPAPVHFWTMLLEQTGICAGNAS